MPRKSWLTIEEYSYAGFQYLTEALYETPARSTARPYCSSSVCRLWRVFDCSEPSTWSSWTGSTPCWIGNEWPLLTIGADGVPGATSTKKLPSRNVRGRIQKVASEWIGRPFESISIVTSDAWQLASPPDLQPGSSATPMTLPTLTPAIRTAEFGTSPLALANVACTVNLPASGFANFVKP